MKAIVSIILCVLLISGGLPYTTNPTIASEINKRISFSACDSPITYKIGTIDKRFNLTQSDVEAAAQRATTIWGEEMGKDLFTFDQRQGDLTINLTYDERQTLTNQITDLNERISDEKDSIDPLINQYEQRVSAFKSRVSNLNTQIAYWNAQGGAPEEEFNKLVTEQQQLKNEASELGQLSQQLNQSTAEYNTQIGELNSTIDTFNSTIKERPEEGLYNGRDNTITIFFMANEDEFLHTLTHEFGHALGMDHVSDPDAIMFYQTNEQLALSSDDKKALQFACRDRSIVDLTSERFSILGERIEKLLQQFNILPQAAVTQNK